VGGAGPLEEPGVEPGVVGDQDALAGELQPAGQHLGEPGGVGHHGVGDAGQDRDQGRDVGLGIDQGLELTEHLAAPDLHRAELGDGVLAGAAGGFQVDHAERDLGQGRAQVIEAGLACRNHTADIKSAH